MHCLTPALTAVPEGEWFCPKCTAEVELRKSGDSSTTAPAYNGSSKKRSREVDEEDGTGSDAAAEEDAEGSDEEPEEHPHPKRPKNSANGSTGKCLIVWVLNTFSLFCFFLTVD